jgi:hypothetical protein
MNSLQFNECLEGDAEFARLEAERQQRSAGVIAASRRPEGPAPSPQPDIAALWEALQRAAGDLAEARRLESDAAFEVERVEGALDRARDALFEAERVADAAAEIAADAFLAGGSSLGQPSVGNGLDHNPRPSPAHDVALRHGIVTRIEHRLEMAISARDRARAAVISADTAHKKAALAIVCADAERDAADLARYEVEAARLWSRLSILNGLWLGGAVVGPPPLGPRAVDAVQSPPRLAMADRSPVEMRAVAEGIAAGWRKRFAELLEGPEVARDAAAD